MIIRWQISQDTALSTMKINQSAFIRDLVIEKDFTKCNVNVIPIKAGFEINMREFEDYKETDLQKY